jgi:hypothetical protein
MKSGKTECFSLEKRIFADISRKSGCNKKGKAIYCVRIKRRCGRG